MALSNTEQVRVGIGDATIPYILTDNQIQHYLTTNSESVNDTIDELQPIVLAALASRGGLYRAEDLWEDTSLQAKNYEIALKRAEKALARTATPIIGGATTEVSLSIDMFDLQDDDTFTGEG